MSLAPYLDAYFSGDQVWANPNPSFADYAAPLGAAVAPNSWFVNSGSPNPVKVTGSVSANAMQLTGAAGVSAIMQGSVFTGAGPGWYVLDVQATLVSGALTGAGAAVNFATDATLSSVVASELLGFAATPDVNGVIQGPGVVGQGYHWRVLFQVVAANAAVAAAYACAHHPPLGSVAAANAIAFQQVAVRPATIAEVAAGNQVQGLPLFPLLPGASPEVDKAPSWSTKVLRASAGNERRTAQWAYPIWNFTLRHEVIRDDAVRAAAFLDEVKAIWELFNTVQGQFGTFLFLDQSAWQVTAEPIGVGDGSTRTFQLYRHIRNWFEPVLTPFGVSLYVNGAINTGVTLGAGGQVTFASPPASGTVISWTGGYFFPCRFGQDDLTLKRIAHQLWSNEGLKFSSVRSLT